MWKPFICRKCGAKIWSKFNERGDNLKGELGWKQLRLPLEETKYEKGKDEEASKS